MVASRESTQSSTSQPAQALLTRRKGTRRLYDGTTKTSLPALLLLLLLPAAGQPRPCLCASYITQTFLMFTLNIIASLLV